MFLRSCPRIFMYMMKFNWLVFLFLLSCSTPIFAIRIEGRARSFQNETITLEMAMDFISMERKVLARCSADDNGSFLLESNDFNLNECRVFYIRTGRYEGVFYGKGNGQYLVNVADIDSETAIRYDKIEFPILLISGSDSIHNATIGYFKKYETFINDHYYDYALQEFSGSEAQRVQLLTHSKNKPDLFPTDLNNRDSIATSNFQLMVRNFGDTVLSSKESEEIFLAQLRDFDLAKMEMVAGKNKAQVIDELFSSNLLPLYHPAYAQCAEMIFSSLFTSSPRDYFLSAQKALQSGQLDSIENHFVRFPIVQSMAHRQTAYCIALRNMLAENKIPISLHDALLKQIADVSRFSEIKNCATHLIQQAHNCKKNATATDFNCIDLKGKNHRAKEWEGKLTYVMFYATWNGYAMKQLQAAENMANSIQGDFNVIAICLDDKEDTWRKATKGKKWKCQMLYAGNLPELREIYCITSLPHALLITPDGKYVQDYTKLPEAGVGAQIEKWLLSHPDQMGKGTWKEN